jgi:uncharacterized protein YcbX
MLHQSKAVTISAINIYPVKSCAGIPLQRSRLTATGFEHDRQWLIVQPNGRFITQREVPHLALIRPELDARTLRLTAPSRDALTLELNHGGAETEVVCWRDRCRAIDAGDGLQWLESFGHSGLAIPSQIC